MTNGLKNIEPKGLEQQPDPIKKFTNDDIQKTNYLTEMKMKELIKPIAFLCLLIAGALFTYFIPGTGIENIVVPLLSTLFGYFGIKNWRENYGVIKSWYQSKTILNAMLVIVPIIVLSLSYFIGFTLPAWLAGVLGTLLTVGGGRSIYGMIDAYKKANAESL